MPQAKLKTSGYFIENGKTVIKLAGDLVEVSDEEYTALLNGDAIEAPAQPTPEPEAKSKK